MKRLLAVFMLLGAKVSSGQFGVSFHQSNLPFVGFHYEIKERWIPELRIGTDNYFSNTAIEGVLLYKFLRIEDFEFYGGVGGRINGLTGAVVPIGLNIYPLTRKRLGLHIELASIIGADKVLRGSWGIRYRFIKE